MNLSKSKLPKVYKRNGRKCYLDPVRKKLIYITPEETIRQKVISYLISVLKVPANMLIVEEPLSHYGIRTKDRADIIIRSATRNGAVVPLAVIECKADTVDLDEKAFDQVLKYSDVLGTDYTVLTNGKECFCFKYDDKTDEYVRIKTLPHYADMMTGAYTPEPVVEWPSRLPFSKLKPELMRAFKDARKKGCYNDISCYTPMELALPVFNLWEGLLDTRVKMPTGEYGLFRLVEDYGIRWLSYGNGSGGHFFGPYRSFIVEVDGNTEFYSLGVSSYWKDGWESQGKNPKTCICVAHDDEETSHHALQLVVEDNSVVNGDVVVFYHHGRIAIGRMGSGKKSDLMSMVKRRYPKIIDGNRYCLGSIKNDHLLRLDEPDVIELVVNLISYSIVRDEYRKKVKEEKR